LEDQNLFDQDWEHYKNGFGTYDAFLLGLEEMHKLTSTGNWEVLLMGKHKAGDNAGKWGKLIYNEFKIGNKDSGYKLTLGARLKKENSGEDGNHLLEYHKDMKFSTKDKDNDQAGSNCAASGNYGGGWWYKGCLIIGLNGYIGRWTPDGASSQTLMAMRPT
jgi:hypothetical protein